MSKRYILIVLAAVLALSSCFKDHSTEADVAITELVPKGELQEFYRRGQGLPLTIPCPEIEMKGVEKPLSYSWEVNYKEVSKEKDLVYPCNEFGIFPVRLKVTNGETTLFFTTQIDVQYRYRKGIYFLWGDASEAKVGYIDPLQPKEDIALNSLALNNPKVTFEGEPHDLAFYANEKYGYKGFLLAAGKNLYSFSPDEMRFLKPLKLSTDVVGLMGDPIDKLGPFFYNGRFGIMDAVLLTVNNNDYRGRLTSLTKKEFGKEPYLAPRLLYWRKVGEASTDGYLVYDNLNEALLAVHKKAEVWFKNETKGYELLEMLSLDQSQQMVLYLRSKSDSSIKELKLKPGLYKAGKRYNHDKELVYAGMVPANAKLAKGSVLVAASLRNLIYYTNPEGKDLYAYSTVSEGNYQGSPLLKTPAGQKVVDMKVDKESKYLYIALTDGSKSTIQRIDLESLKVDMEWTDLQVKIVKIALREDNPTNL